MELQAMATVSISRLVRVRLSFILWRKLPEHCSNGILLHFTIHSYWICIMEWHFVRWKMVHHSTTHRTLGRNLISLVTCSTVVSEQMNSVLVCITNTCCQRIKNYPLNGDELFQINRKTECCDNYTCDELALKWGSLGQSHMLSRVHILL